MKQIRIGVFETNSSSCHSLVIDPHGSYIQNPVSPMEAEQGYININPGEFGWDVKTFCDRDTKLSYLVTDILRDLPEDTDLDTLSSPKLTLLKEAVMSFTGLSIRIVAQTNSYWNFGYIDHQSNDIPGDVWNMGIDGIINFVFKNTSTLHTDNDNY